MDAAVWGFVGVVVGGIITAVVTLGGEMLRGRREADLDSRRRSDDRRIEREALQRTTLLALQEALTEWMSFVTQTDMRVETSPKKPEERQVHQVTEFEIAIERQFRYLTERVRNDELRASLNALAALRLSHVYPTTREAADRGSTELAVAYGEIQRLVGTVLREYL